MTNQHTAQAPRWATLTLQLAGIYNILWGSWVVFFPQSFFMWADLPLTNYPAIWQSVGMIVGVYGLGYFLASFDPYKHWIITLVGFLGKVFGPIGFVMYAVQGKLPWQFGLINITNDIIWIVPFALILFGAYKNKVYLELFKSKSSEEILGSM